MSLIPITKELIDELEDFKRLYKNVWFSIIGQVALTRYVPSASSRGSGDVGKKMMLIVNELAHTFYEHWKDFVKQFYGEEICGELLNILQDIIGDEIRLHKNRAVEQWFRGLITTQQFAECIAHKLQCRLGKEIENVAGHPKTVQVKVFELSDLKDLFPA
jgi:hypothetical protein